MVMGVCLVRVGRDSSQQINPSRYSRIFNMIQTSGCILYAFIQNHIALKILFHMQCDEFLYLQIYTLCIKENIIILFKFSITNKIFPPI